MYLQGTILMFNVWICKTFIKNIFNKKIFLYSDEEKENIKNTRLKMVHFDKEPSRGETREERISRQSGKCGIFIFQHLTG